MKMERVSSEKGLISEQNQRRSYPKYPWHLLLARELSALHAPGPFAAWSLARIMLTSAISAWHTHPLCRHATQGII
jgi:hypothetical protein